MAWFKKARKPMVAPGTSSRVPEGLWVKCPECDTIIYTKDLAKTLSVCPKCAHHFRLTAIERLRSLFDDEHWVEHDAGLASNDPLTFTDTKPYAERLTASRKATGLKDALVVGAGTIEGLPAIVAAMEYGFIGGSMGVVMGEKLVRAIEAAVAGRKPVLIVSCSGGARMMEGALSLMQMAKVSAALARLDRAQLPFLSILTDPTTGGVTASFAMLGDCHPGRAQGAHRLCRAPGDRADHPPEAAGRLPAQRVPARARHARPGGRSARAASHHRPAAALHGRDAGGGRRRAAG